MREYAGKGMSDPPDESLRVGRLMIMVVILMIIILGYVAVTAKSPRQETLGPLGTNTSTIK